MRRFPFPTLLPLLASLCLPHADGADGVDVSLQQPPMMTSQQSAAGQNPPVAAVEPTTRTCLADALARLPDRLYCNKYYVCSNGVYIGQFCPTGMAFDYGLQTCRLRQEVRCVQRPLIFGETAPSQPMATQNLTVLPTTTTMLPTTIAVPRRPDGDRNTMVLPFGGRVIIPAGSTLVLPPGTEIHPGPAMPGMRMDGDSQELRD